MVQARGIVVHAADAGGEAPGVGSHDEGVEGVVEVDEMGVEGFLELGIEAGFGIEDGTVGISKQWPGTRVRCSLTFHP